ncbi:MAG: ABC transporter ATP-binding protein [Actinobacteria bacterium]|nr:ABC transporter ATP-binding protein [Actinomycetota bacterium]
MSMQAVWMTHRSMTADPSVKEQKLKAGTVKRIFDFARPYRKYLSVFLFTVVIDAFLVVATPLILRKLIDDGVIPKNGPLITELAFIVGLLAIADAVMSIVGRWFSARIGEGLIYDLRSQVFAHVQKQSIAFFTRTQTGALISRINSDVIGAQQAFTSSLSGVLSNVITLILIPTKWVGRKLQALTRDSFDLNAAMSSRMTERFNVSGAMLVALYGEPGLENESFRSRARRVADIGISMAMLNRIFFIALTSVAAVATAFAYGIGGHLAISGAVTVGTLLAITALLARLYGPLTALSNVRIDVMTALVSFERVFEVLDLQPMVTDKANARVLAKKIPSVEFKNVYFSYPKPEEISLASLESAAKEEKMESGEILKGVSFSVPSGTFTAIVGPSGAGKTTISALVPRLYDVTSGSIEVDGIDIRDLTLDSLRSSIGVVTQDAHLFHESIADNLRYAKHDATEKEMQEACRAAQIWDLVDSLPNKLNTLVGERGHRLSGGEKQRLAIARLLLKSPSVVILDEATAHLDSENEALVQQALKSALKGRTSIVIAHRLSTVKDADQIIVLEHGNIVECGTHEELVNAGGLYSELYVRQDLGAFTNESSSVDN